MRASDDLRLGTTSTAPQEPLPPPPEEQTAVRAGSPGEWLRVNLFPTPVNGLLSVVMGSVLAYVVYRFVRYVFVTGRWEIVRVNLRVFLLGRFPPDELARVWGAIFIAALVAGMVAGVSSHRRGGGDLRASVRRAAPLLLVLVVLLTFSRTWLPALLTVASFGVAGIGHLLGKVAPPKLSRRLPLLALAGVLGAYVVLTAFGGVGWALWGGLLLTLFLALGGIVISFPFGVLLALGRRSSFPAIRVVCVAYIELIRGVPLITLIFMAFLMVGFFLPPRFPTPDLTTRVLIALILFTAAYVAEVVRGGLQSVPRGQIEAAQAIGLSPLKQTYKIVLPQALRNVIPALVGQFISLFKDTSLVAFVGALDLLNVAQVVTSQGAFLAQGLAAETLSFVSLIYWACCYSMSRASQRLEKRLGVGER